MGSIGLLGIILSHLMVLIIFVFPLLFWISIQIYSSIDRKETLKKIFLSFALGLGLSSYYLLPALLEKQYTVASSVLQSYYSDHFVTLAQLVYSRWGYGFDFPGTVSDEMSFQIGLAQWIVVAGLAGILAVNWIRKRKAEYSLLFLISCFLFSIFMMVPFSKSLWEVITKYAYFDFPWRFLSLSVFGSSLAGAVLIKQSGRYRWAILGFFLIIAFYSNRNYLRVNQYVYQPDSFYKNNLQTTNQYDEYRPKTANSDYLKEKREKISFDTKNINIKNEVLKSNYISLSGTANIDETIKINTSFYPGWKVWVNSKEQQSIMSDNGILQAFVPKGQFKVEIKFTNTILRSFSNFLSLASILIFLMFLKSALFSKQLRGR